MDKTEMTLNEYAALAQHTSNQKSLSGKLENGCLGLAGEAGEVCDVLKKYLYQGHELDRAGMAYELGDVLWYVVETAAGLDLTLEDVARMNVEKLKKRYPQGFDAERSVHRDE